MQRNNVLLIMADQWRWDGLGVTGGWVETPNLDRLARQGVLFENCITNSPVCVPARISMATGLYPHNTGIWGNVEYDLPANSKTWMQRVRELGYRTSLIGKSHLHRHVGDLREREHMMRAYGFDDVDEIGGPRRSMTVGSNLSDLWAKHGVLESYVEDYRERFSAKPFVAKPSPLPLELYADVYVGQRAKQYIREYNHDEPWFSLVSFGGPHEPWDAPEPYASMYDPKEMPRPIPRSDSAPGRPEGFLDQLYLPGNSHSPDISRDELAAMRANYAGNITLIDEQIGEILAVLEENGELARTDILFVSDHGEMNGDHGLIYKENFLNGSVKVPLVISTAEMRRSGAEGARYSGMVEWFDLGPTVCDLAGDEDLPLPYTQFAKSLGPVLRDLSLTHRTEAVCELHGEILIQTEDWKMAVNNEGDAYLLFHLAVDPDERVNLIGVPGAEPAVRRLKDVLLRRLIGSQKFVEAQAMGERPPFPEQHGIGTPEARGSGAK